MPQTPQVAFCGICAHLDTSRTVSQTLPKMSDGLCRRGPNHSLNHSKLSPNHLYLIYWVRLLKATMRLFCGTAPPKGHQPLQPKRAGSPRATAARRTAAPRLASRITSPDCGYRLTRSPNRLCPTGRLCPALALCG